MLLNLVAHAVGYKVIVGAHNTVDVRRMWEVLPCSMGTVNANAHNTIDVRRMWEVLPYSPCMANDGAHNTVEAQRHVGGFTIFAWYGS